MNTKYIEDGSNFISTDNNNSDGKKNILLIGDSIRCGYCGTVKDKLKDVANVYFPDDNCRNTQYIITSLAWWLDLCDGNKVDLVYFNAGHWDVAHWESSSDSLTPINQYAFNIALIAERLKGHFPDAKICFATTTPMNPNGNIGRNPRSNSEICLYNDEAKKALLNTDVSVDDLYSLLCEKDSSWYADYCHYTEEGFSAIGTHVAEFIRKELNI